MNTEFLGYITNVQIKAPDDYNRSGMLQAVFKRNGVEETIVFDRTLKAHYDWLIANCFLDSLASLSVIRGMEQYTETFETSPWFGKPEQATSLSWREAPVFSFLDEAAAEEFQKVFGGAA